MIANRADSYVSDLAVNARLRRREGFDPALARPAMRIDDKTGFYLASGIGAHAEITSKVRNTFLALEKMGRYQMVDATEKFDAPGDN